MSSKKLSAISAVSVVAIVLVSVLVSAEWIAAQNTSEGSKKVAEPTSMTNQRLGMLLKQHFPKAHFLQNGPNVWIVQIKPIDDSEQDSADSAEAENDQGSTEDANPDNVGGNGRLMVITDANANRMRIMMPIQSFNPEKNEDLKTAILALHANYDRALDARYAISEGILWSAFIHPLRSLTEADLASALEQVQTLRKNTGTTFSSGALIFGPQNNAAPPKNQKDEENGKDQTA